MARLDGAFDDGPARGGFSHGPLNKRVAIYVHTQIIRTYKPRMAQTSVFYSIIKISVAMGEASQAVASSRLRFPHLRCVKAGSSLYGEPIVGSSVWGLDCEILP